MKIVGNGRLFTNQPDSEILSSGAVAIKDGLVVKSGEYADLKKEFPDHEFIDAKGGLIMPGIINTHHHFYSGLARGMMIKNPKSSKNFLEILENVWWRLDRALTLESTYYSAALSIVESIRAGVTSIVDHHAGFGAVRGSLNEIAKASDELGVRACLCYEVSDRDGAKLAQDSIDENRDFLNSLKGKDKSMLAGLFGLHASFTISDKNMEKCKEAAGDAGFHVHLAEGLDDQKLCLKEHGKRISYRLNDFDILGEKTLAVHCIHVSAGEIQLLADTNTTVIHNPQSNMGNAVGCSPLLEFIKKGILVGIGTDAYTHDLFESSKTAVLLQRHNLSDPSVAWGEVYNMLLQNNPKIASQIFETKLGVLDKGYAADLIILDYDPLTPLTKDNLQGHIHFGMYGPMVKTSLINGQLVLLDGELKTADEAKLRAESRQVAKALWDRM